jgi:hypothetical protein
VAGIGIPFHRLAALGITQYQVVQDEPGRILLRLIAPTATTASAKESVENGAREHLLRSLGTDIHMEVEFTQHIEPTTAGKHLAILSRLNPGYLPSRVEEENGP